MKNLERIGYISVIAFLIFLLLRGCKKDIPKKETVKTVTKTEYVPVQGKSETSYVPTPYAVHDTIIEDNHSINIDNNTEYEDKPENYGNVAVIKLYRDSLSFGDSVGYAIVNDSVNGTILKRDFQFSIKKKTTTTEITKEIFPKRKAGFYFGGETMLPVNKLDLTNVYLGASLLLRTKREELYKVSFGRLNSTNYAGFSYFKKIN